MVEYKNRMDFDRLKRNSEVGKELCDIEEFYRNVDSHLEAFDSDMGIHCICTAGTCCKHFIPDLTPLEAEYLAYIVLKSNREEEICSRLASYDPQSGICPLYNKDGSFHCSLYQGRGLLCRLFGAACFVDKNGKGIFHACKWNDDRKDISEESLEGKTLPIMGDYGRELMALDGNEHETELIHIALPKAIAKIEFIISLLEQEAPQGA